LPVKPYTSFSPLQGMNRQSSKRETRIAPAHEQVVRAHGTCSAGGCRCGEQRKRACGLTRRRAVTPAFDLSRQNVQSRLSQHLATVGRFTLFVPLDSSTQLNPLAGATADTCMMAHAMNAQGGSENTVHRRGREGRRDAVCSVGARVERRTEAHSCKEPGKQSAMQRKESAHECCRRECRTSAPLSLTNSPTNKLLGLECKSSGTHENEALVATARHVENSPNVRAPARTAC